MTVIIKYPVQTPKRNEVFFEKKNKELTNLDWAKWAGWFDTDGCFKHHYNTSKKNKKTGEPAPARWESVASMRLKDRQPVELFSKIFEGSMLYIEQKTTTPEPYKYEYTSKMYVCELGADKGRWFTKNIYPYLINEKKKDFAVRLLGYKPESKDFTNWTRGEITNYLATVMEGDGSVRCIASKTTKHLATRIKSSDVQYLSDVSFLLEKKLAVISTLREHSTYMTKEGIKTKYELFIYCSQKNPGNLDLFQSLIKDNVMTLDRKKNPIKEFVDYAA